MKIKTLILLFISLFTLMGCQREPDVGILKVGICPDYPPFVYTKGDQIVGFDVELVQEVAKALGKKVVIQVLAQHQLIQALQTGQIDLAVGAVTITAERQKNVDFSAPYYYGSIAMIYRKDQPIPDLAKLDNHRIGVQLGTTMEQCAKQLASQFQGITLSSLDTNGPLIEKLKLGEIDFILVENLQAKEFCAVNATLAYQEIGKSPEGYGIVMKKKSMLVQQVNPVLAQLMEKGVITQLEEKWIK